MHNVSWRSQAFCLSSPYHQHSSKYTDAHPHPTRRRVSHYPPPGGRDRGTRAWRESRLGGEIGATGC